LPITNFFVFTPPPPPPEIPRSPFRLIVKRFRSYKIKKSLLIVPFAPSRFLPTKLSRYAGRGWWSDSPFLQSFFSPAPFLLSSFSPPRGLFLALKEPSPSAFFQLELSSFLHTFPPVPLFCTPPPNPRLPFLHPAKLKLVFPYSP